MNTTGRQNVHRLSYYPPTKVNKTFMNELVFWNKEEVIGVSMFPYDVYLGNYQVNLNDI